MAEVLDDYEFAKRASVDTYPWDEWFDGRTWRVVEGADFAISAASFTTNLYGAAKRRGGKVTANRRGLEVVFRFIPAADQ